MQKEPKSIIIRKLKRAWLPDHPAAAASSWILSWRRTAPAARRFITKPAEKMHSIGAATVYRMVNMLEEIGAISRKNMYKVACEELCEDGSCEAENRKKNVANGCVVELSDRTTYCLSAEKLDAVFQAGLKACGYIEDQEIKKIAWNSDMCCAR